MSTVQRMPKTIAVIVVATLSLTSPAFALFTGNSDAMFSGNPVMTPVCWMNANDQDAKNLAARRELQDAIESEWQYFARVNFVGFKPCSQTPNVRRIEVTFDNNPGGQCPWTEDPKATKKCRIGISCVSNSASCIRGNVLHEIGHAIGYYHEEERLDYNHTQFWSTAGIPEQDCKSQDWCSPNNPNLETCPKQIKLGGYDPNSIMAYCQPGNKLSPNDIFAHQHIYGFRKPDMIMTPQGNCLTINFSNNNLAVTLDCDEAAGQKWRRSIDGVIKSQQDTSKCLGFSSRPATNGTSVQGLTCGSSPVKWDIEQAEVRGFAGKCLTLKDGNTANGTAVFFSECNGSAASQKWSISSKGEIKFGALTSTKCINVASGNTANGTKTEIRDCDNSSSQRFSFANNNIKFGGKCLDVRAWNDATYWPNGAVGTNAAKNLPGDGAQLQIFDCLSNQFNQKFWLAGSLKTNGKCLDLENGSTANGTRIQLWDCLNNKNQRWAIFF